MTETQFVVFDVGRVLFRWDLRYLYAKLIDDRDELEWFVANVVTPEWHFEHDAGRELQEMVAERKLAFPGYAALIDAYASRFLESIPGPVPGSLPLVENLASEGVPLFAITNFAAPFWAEFRAQQPIFDLFGDIVVSGEEKMAKPGEAIFLHAARRFEINPAKALFIDDSEANIAAAQALGWQVHHFSGSDALRDDLVARGLLPA